MPAYINHSDTFRDDLDTLAEVPVTTIKGSALRAGMVLVDPTFHTPAAEIDHRVRATRGSGAAAALIFDYDARRYVTQYFYGNADIKVMAR